SGPSSPSSTGPPSPAGWRPRCWSTVGTSSTRASSAPRGSPTRESGAAMAPGAPRYDRMRALVLVGGEGTRLRPLTLTQPKPAVPLVDRPFIRYMVDWLARHGVDDVIMACGFRAELLRERLGAGGDGPRIRYVEEPEPLGTAGPIR